MDCAKYALLVTLAACTPSESRSVTEPTDEDVSGGDSDLPAETPPAPYTSLTFAIEAVDTQTPTTAAGYQGKLLRGPDGTLYYAYMQATGLANDACDIAVFGSGESPGATYGVRVAVRPPAASTWSIEDVLDGQTPDYVTARWGLDAVIDGSARLVLTFAGGPGPGLFDCAGAGDLVVATRQGAGSYDVQVRVADSSGCCTPCNNGGACTNGEDVGRWAAATLDGQGALAVMYMDYHNSVDEDGATPGLELWQTGGVTGIRPWSMKGTFGVLRSTTAGLIAAYTTRAQTGLYVARQTGSAGSPADWVEQNLRDGWKVGERLAMAVAPDGTIGLAFNARQNNLGLAVDDLVYCWSQDGGVTWSVPCETVDNLGNVGRTPSLAFDRTSRPAVSYYYCGAGGSCAASADGLRFAWRDEVAGRWKRFNVRFDAGHQDGIYGSLVMHPDTDEPLIAFQDITTGAAMLARGTLGN